MALVTRPAVLLQQPSSSWRRMSAIDPKHFLSISDLDEGELLHVLDLAGELKRGEHIQSAGYGFARQIRSYLYSPAMHDAFQAPLDHEKGQSRQEPQRDKNFPNVELSALNCCCRHYF